MSYLTFILSRAVPDVRVEMVQVVETPANPQWGLDLEAGAFRVIEAEYKYTLDVRPRPHEYWRWFRETFPNWQQLAFKYGATVYSVMVCRLCPEFPSRNALVSWLSDVLSLSPGERRLLRLCGAV
ncbi:hypothetical protein DRO59_00940 [Candidatus Bathyarchaeota archaeon]|nr:MAG: hypothetical protein DRO59_00940 [Candidatus Bathyarchaeota archaeon]